MSSERNELLKNKKKLFNYKGAPTFSRNSVSFGPQTAEVPWLIFMGWLKMQDVENDGPVRTEI